MGAFCAWLWSAEWGSCCISYGRITGAVNTYLFTMIRGAPFFCFYYFLTPSKFKNAPKVDHLPPTVTSNMAIANQILPVYPQHYPHLKVAYLVHERKGKKGKQKHFHISVNTIIMIIFRKNRDDGNWSRYGNMNFRAAGEDNNLNRTLARYSSVCWYRVCLAMKRVDASFSSVFLHQIWGTAA